MMYKIWSHTKIVIVSCFLLVSTSVAESAEYNIGDACTVAGAYQEKNDSIGYYGLICDGSFWVLDRLVCLSGACGGNNLSLGPYSLGPTATGADNTAFGTGAGFSSTTGYGNVAMGAWALYTNQTGNQNTALGAYALFDNTASWNTAVGRSSLANNAGGQGNTAIGNAALIANISGSWNVAVGNNAMNKNTGSDNVAVGAGAFENKVGGQRNIALGFQAGDSATSGSNNILIGYDVQKPTASESRHMNIGNIIYASGLYNTTTHVGIGKSSPVVTLDVVGDINYTGVLADVSDIRMKEEIRLIEGALEKVMQLNGISFVMKDDPEKVRELGLSAQDVQKVFPELVVEAGGVLAVNYSGMVGPLVEAVKEQQMQIELIKQENILLRQRMDALEGK